ncbi:hypothetical protein L204_101050 [Cryptococcus depauperatus]|nr:transporter particle component [Cryptococcus depauperatus CBS 7855]
MSRPSSSSTHLPIAPTVPPALHSLANPAPVLIDAQLPGYLLPCVLDLLRESSKRQVMKRRAEEEQLRNEGLLPLQSENEPEEAAVVEEELAKRIERIGIMVGGYIAEKLTLARPPLVTHLDIIKFICKDLFLHVYSKQIDNLRTNHRGIYVLQSHSFPPLAPMSSCKGSASDMEAAKTHLLFPQALMQGALYRLGLNAHVSAESAGLPQCTFQIRTLKSPTISATPNIGGAPNLAHQSQNQSAPPPLSTVGSVTTSVGGSASTGPGIGSG